MDVHTLKKYIVEILEDIVLDEAMAVGGGGGAFQIQGFSGPSIPKLVSKSKKRAKSKKKKKSQ